MNVDLSFTDSPRQRLEAVITQLHDLGALSPVIANPQDHGVAGVDALGALEITIEQIRAAVSAMNHDRTEDGPSC